LKKELDAINAPFVNAMVMFGQGFKDISPALETLETALLNDQVAHGDNPLLTMCAMNSRVEMDAAGNRKLSKAKATGRIDGMVACVMAVGVSNMPQEKPKTYQTFFVGGHDAPSR
jgi:phage terminase large subunit-like protein